MTTTYTDLTAGLETAAAALRIAAQGAEHVADWGALDERVEPGTVLDRLENMSLKIVRLLAAAEKAHLRPAADIRDLDRRDRITYELLHTAGAAAMQFRATLTTVVDEHRTLP